MSYTISGGEDFNMVLSHKDSTNPSTWNPENAITDMRQHFADWDPRYCLHPSHVKSMNVANIDSQLDESYWYD